MPIKNIIFDLGGVIINIDYILTANAFHHLGAVNFDALYTQKKQHSIFDLYETGKISSATFREQLCAELDLEISDEAFDKAWNAMLLDLPGKRLELIRELGKEYKTYLFSNTNEIHLKKVFEICQQDTGFRNFDGLFEREYYSHQFGKRKPHSESFKAILIENNLKPEETLFIDDSRQHVLGAREADLHAIHLTHDMSILNLGDYIKQMESAELSKQESSPRTYSFSL